MTAFVHYADIDVHSCCSLRAELEDSNKVDKVVKFGEYVRNRVVASHVGCTIIPLTT